MMLRFLGLFVFLLPCTAIAGECGYQVFIADKRPEIIKGMANLNVGNRAPGDIATYIWHKVLTGNPARKLKDNKTYWVGFTGVGMPNGTKLQSIIATTDGTTQRADLGTWSYNTNGWGYKCWKLSPRSPGGTVQFKFTFPNGFEHTTKKFKYTCSEEGVPLTPNFHY